MAAESVGKHTYNLNCINVCTWGEGASLKIGSFCSIASCNIYLGGNHRIDWITTYPFGHINQHIFNKFNGAGHPKTNGDVIVGSDVWIANAVTIMSGVKIGHGAVLANNSHVVKDVAPYSIVGGNPARLIKYRFSEDIIKKLLQIKWWEWEDSKINDNLYLICSDNMEEFCKLYYVEIPEENVEIAGAACSSN